MPTLQQLLDLKAEQPEDPFTSYALAQAYLREGRHQEAESEFSRLAKTSPDYLPTYYHWAAVLAELDRRDEAMEVYANGIALANVKGDTHTLAELRNARMNLELED